MNPEEFTLFKENIARLGTRPSAYSRFPMRNSSVRKEYTLIDIKGILSRGDPFEIRQLSRHFYRYSGVYSRAVEYFATLLAYRTVMVPKFDTSRPPKKAPLLRSYYKACDFIDAIKVPTTFSDVTRSILIEGVFFGILIGDDTGAGDSWTLSQLPVEYCRTRFKTSDNLNILEFNLTYFITIAEQAYIEAALTAFPPHVAAAYNAYKLGQLTDPWIEILPSDGAAVFYYGDIVPLLASTIPSIFSYMEAQDRESERDENELYKLLIQKMPLDEEGNLKIPMPEVLAMHEAVSNMLRDKNTIEVLTTFGETSMESVQDSSTTNASNSRLEKYKESVFDEIGTSSGIFNSQGNLAVGKSIEKDTGLMTTWAAMYANWLSYQINRLYTGKNWSFTVDILPISYFNMKDMSAMYLSAAQFGFSKIYAGVASGVKQSQLKPLLSFEEDYLGLSESLIPLQSSHTASAEGAKDGKTKNGLTTEGGRPTLDDTKKADKTVQNEN